MKKPYILIALVLFLVMTNVATVLSVVLHIRQTDQATVSEPVASDSLALPDRQRVIFFTEQLGLTPEQQDAFREVSFTYNQAALTISNEMAVLRNRQLMAMHAAEPDMNQLNTLSEEIGQLHTRLKNLTIGYYLGLKGICTVDQQQQSYAIFKKILNPEGEVDLPRGGPRGRSGRGGGPPADRGPWWQRDSL